MKNLLRFIAALLCAAAIHAQVPKVESAVSITGTAGNGYVSYNTTQSSAPATPAAGFVEYADSSGQVAWRRASDTFVRTFASTLTANRTYTWPDATITIAGSASALTSGRVPFVTTGGLLLDASTMTFSSGTLTLGGNLVFGTSGSTLNGTTGSIGLTATGTNQSITLTPSGTGAVVVAAAGTSGAMTFAAGAADKTSGFGFANSTYVYASAAGSVNIENQTASGSARWRAINSSGQVALFGVSGGANGIISGDALGDTVFQSPAKELFTTNGTTIAFTLDASQNAQLVGKVTSYNGIATTGNGVATIQGSARVTAQTAANASVATYTLGAADASFIVSANVLVTTSGSEAFTATCSYTDEGNTARVLTFNFSLLAGTLGANIAFANGAVPYEGVPLHIRCKASTAITIKTAAGGTYTGCTYNAEGVIQKLQ